MTHPTLPQQRHLWGRRQARPLKDNQRQALNNLWPEISLSLPAETLIDVKVLFPMPPQDLWLEIGFGGGEHLAAQAALHPKIGFIGCEPFVNGVASLTLHIQEHSLKNIRIVQDDARLLLARLPDQSVGRIFVLFPDPWPKKRHHKRRIIQEATIDAFSRILKPHGYLYMATDHEEYGEWMQDVMTRHPHFKPTLEGRKSVKDRPLDWPPTRYEQKGLAQGRGAVYLLYQFRT